MSKHVVSTLGTNAAVHRRQQFRQREKRYASLFIAIMILALFYSSQPAQAANEHHATASSGSSDRHTQTIAKPSWKNQTDFIVQGVSIGISEQALFELLGEPARKDISEYGFEWYVYNHNYKRYLQVGVNNGKVVALYTNSQDWTAASGIHFGSTRSEVEAALGPALTKIKKGNTIYNYKDNGRKLTIHRVGDLYAILFYDLSQQDTVTAIQLIAAETELAFKGYYGTPSERLRESFEREVFDLTNAIRVRYGKEPYEWDDVIADTARKHSTDMKSRNFFNHNNPDGKTPFDRIKKDGITYIAAGENIAAGQTSAIFVHEDWMNSSKHRKNIMGDYERLGVGVSFDGKSNVFYTQNFYTPKP
ncbi:CAP domain-containing protein [Paenibacillus apiarius]|uniref:CAP domain-containing protein n=1 Tax=Paenibacillus apiarius TaxID=46240 RepID=UPI00197FD981|nr:CAP domain-containing protein [Paenibacillus apiarius]MBN3525610.1 CAP domain-containing protein [Paenibacillus apiarius]